MTATPDLGPTADRRAPGAPGTAGRHDDRRSPPAVGADPEQVRAAVADLCSPAQTVQVRETHISWLFLTPDRAFKLKKPIVLDFLDYGTARRRQAMCHAEIRLNARLAPDVYLGVRGIVDAGDRLRIADEDDRGTIDYLVEMRRYDESHTLSAAVARHQISAGRLTQLAQLLAGFHRVCPSRTDRAGAVTVRHETQKNLGGLADQLTACDDREQTLALGRFLQAFTAANADMLDGRARAGAIREAHGDLRAEHVILEPVVSVVDCVEFDRDLRTVDVADDLAFLVMDLCALGAEPAARALIAEYRRAGGDCGSDELVWFFAVHRALVRAKVELVRAAQLSGDDAGHNAAASRLLDVAYRCAWRARGRRVIVVCGVPASGKSHLAQAISASAGLPMISSDVVRKQLAGIAATDHAPAPAYRPIFSQRTYRELGRRAAQAVADGSGALVDATFRRAADRAAFTEGFADAASLTFVQCVAPDAVLAQRATARDHDPARISDATADIVASERHRFQALDEVGAHEHLLLRTDRPTAAMIADLLALLDVRLTRRS